MDQREDWHLTEIIEHGAGRSDPFAAAVRATRMPMVITNPALADNPIVFANEAFQKLVGYPREEIVGRNCRFLQGPDTNKADVARVSNAVQRGEAINVDLLNYKKDGSTFWNALYISPVRNDGGEIIYFFASQLDVSDRIAVQSALENQKAIIEQEVQKRTAELELALEAKNILLHEIDHRVKNNLMMIGSLLRLQARSVGDSEISAKLNAMLERVDALASVHRRLYESDNLSIFDVGSFAETLLRDVISASGRSNIRLDIQCAPIFVPARHATALGLILNELFTNAIKHAFADGRSGTISLSTMTTNGDARISISDDGPGMSNDRTTSGLGLTLMKRLSKQTGTEFKWIKADHGAHAVLTFKTEDAS